MTHQLISAARVAPTLAFRSGKDLAPMVQTIWAGIKPAFFLPLVSDRVEVVGFVEGTLRVICRSGSS